MGVSVGGTVEGVVAAVVPGIVAASAAGGRAIRPVSMDKRKAAVEGFCKNEITGASAPPVRTFHRTAKEIAKIPTRIARRSCSKLCPPLIKNVKWEK